MAYKTKYMRYIEELQKRVPNVIKGFRHELNAWSRYSFVYRYNEDFSIELDPEYFHSKTMSVDKWHIYLWERLIGCDGDLILKHEYIEDENEIPKRVEEYKNYIANLPD